MKKIIFKNSTKRFSFLRKTRITSIISISCFFLLVFTCCREEKPPAKTCVGKLSEHIQGVFILNEGLFNMNNSTLTHVDGAAGIVTTDYFSAQNKRPLGDTGNDIAIYGNKMYIVLNVSSQIEVTDLHGKTIKQIPLFRENGKGRQPRYIAFHEGKAYVTLFDGYVTRIDTASLEVEADVKVGRNPEGICIVNDKIYVANSGGLDAPDYDNTVSVVDITSFNEIKKITVAMNPYKIAADTRGNVYVNSRGNYGNTDYYFQRISNDELAETYAGINTLNFTIAGDYAYMYNYNFGAGSSWIKRFDLKSGAIDTDWNPVDVSLIKIPYGISVDAQSGDVYITDAVSFIENGNVYCFTKQGRKKFQFEAELNPNKIVFVYK